MRVSITVDAPVYHRLYPSLPGAFYAQTLEYKRFEAECSKIESGCYVGFVDDGPDNCLYVGQSANLAKRFEAHATKGADGPMYLAGLVLIYPCPRRHSGNWYLDEVEQTLIKKWSPSRNKAIFEPDPNVLIHFKDPSCARIRTEYRPAMRYGDE